MRPVVRCDFRNQMSVDLKKSKKKRGRSQLEESDDRNRETAANVAKVVRLWTAEEEFEAAFGNVDAVPDAEEDLTLEDVAKLAKIKSWQLYKQEKDEEVAKENAEIKLARDTAEKLATPNKFIERDFRAKLKTLISVMEVHHEKLKLVIDAQLPNKEFRDFIDNETLREFFEISVRCVRPDCNRCFFLGGKADEYCRLCSSCESTYCKTCLCKKPCARKCASWN